MARPVDSSWMVSKVAVGTRSWPSLEGLRVLLHLVWFYLHFLALDTRGNMVNKRGLIMMLAQCHIETVIQHKAECPLLFSTEVP